MKTVTVRMNYDDLAILEKALLLNVDACDDTLTLFRFKLATCPVGEKANYQKMIDTVTTDRAAIQQRLNQIRSLTA